MSLCLSWAGTKHFQTSLRRKCKSILFPLSMFSAKGKKKQSPLPLSLSLRPSVCLVEGQAVPKRIQSCGVDTPHTPCEVRVEGSSGLAKKALATHTPQGHSLTGSNPWTQIDLKLIKLQEDDPNQHGILFSNFLEQSFLLTSNDEENKSFLLFWNHGKKCFNILKFFYKISLF